MSIAAKTRAKSSRQRNHGLTRQPSWAAAKLLKSCRQRWLCVVMFILGLFTLWTVALTKLTQEQQVVFALLCFAVFMVVNRLPGRGVSLFLIILSVTVSLRYIVWRVTSTLNFDSLPTALLGTGLILAESYAVLVLLLGYFQTAWPLDRKPAPLRGLPQDWPTVDVYIPTYNEDLDIVRQTVLAAMSMDYPAAKLNVYILDDGKRQIFREFAEQVGCGYIARTDNAHAKAGNLNHALQVTNGEFIAVFDCDHIPTRAFLQMSLGWLIRDKKMALIQTPHHFYTPDPFEKNLATGESVPSEGNMFYGLVQPGNDFWNAAFFCGSCAILRRSALEGIGGFAVQTVTEDAHTAIRLQRYGWNTGYLNLPLAAGLATERLSAHIGQRARWARGMMQIMRLDNPLFGRGLRLPQRLCYLNAMLHFLFPLPRLVFLTAPLAYLLLGENIIAASPVDIVAYAGPHVVHSIATSSRLQRFWRHSFWSDVYETVLALPLVRPTITVLINPNRGKFNVTAKGTIIENDYWDFHSLRPNLILCGLLVAGLLHGIYGIITEPETTIAFQAFLLNSIWVVLSLLTVLGAIAVGKEKRQPRRRPRFRAEIPVIIELPDGTEIHSETRDLSGGGASLYLDQPIPVAARSQLRIYLPIGGKRSPITAKLLWSKPHNGGFLAGIGFKPLNINEETAIIRAVFGRADAWLDWNDYQPDRPLTSLRNLLISVFSVFRKSKELPPAAVPYQENSEISYEEDPALASGSLPGGGTIVRPRNVIIGVLALCMLLSMAFPSAASAQQDEAATSGLANPPLPPLPPLEQSGSAAASDTSTAPTMPFTTLEEAPDTTRTLVLNLKQLGAYGPLNLRGDSPIQGVTFGIRSDEVVTGAILTLSGAMSPALVPSRSNVTVTINQQYIGTIPVNPTHRQFGPLTMNINPAFFISNAENKLNFHFTGQYTTGCNNPLSSLLWSKISDTSTLTIFLTRLPPQLDLSELPRPFFDPYDTQPLKLAFVLPVQADDAELRAAGIAASWFGKLSGFRSAKFSASHHAPQIGNGVVIAVGNDGASAFNLPPFQGPTLAEVPNPNDPFGSLLVIGGRTGNEAVVAAQALAAGSQLISGSEENVSKPALPERHVDDAPNWLPTNRKVRVGELVAPHALNGNGYSSVVDVPFQIAPDLYTWRQTPYPLNVFFRAPPGPVLDVAASHLDVLVNGTYLASTSLAPKVTLIGWLKGLFSSGGFSNGEQHFVVEIPPYDLYTRNQLQFVFDTRPLNRGACGTIPGDIKFGIDPNSTLNFTGTYHFTQLPNLGYFSDGGYPFTRYADLSDSAVVLSTNADDTELSAYLDLMGMFGSETGYPAYQVAVVQPEELQSVANRNLLVLTDISQAGQVTQLFSDTPVRLNNDFLTVPLPGEIAQIGQVFDDPVAANQRRAAAVLQTPLVGNDALLMEAKSPLNHKHTEVILLGANTHAINDLVTALGNPSLQPHIKGDLTILSSGVATSYQIGQTYWVGWIPLWLWPTWLLRNQPYLMLLFLIGACLLTAAGIYWPLRRRAARKLSIREKK